ncbi:DUF1028 domain-containing protein [bacterium]|nr:DUF1028 domain-containing protein [bacterium]
MKICLLFLSLLLCISAVGAAEVPTHTYSIVARDPQTGELGVAVQSHYFSVGQRVPWAEAGIGAIATQSFTEPSYGALGLQLMKAGKTAPDALKALIAADSIADVRQVAMIDANGNVATHTGKKCIADAGHHIGKNYSVQANLMANANIWPAMAKAFESAQGSLAERMLAALEAAQNAGGDIRGEQSAAILVVSGKPTGISWKDRILDLRVEDNPHPLQELRRLMRIQEAYHHEDLGDNYIAENNLDAAFKEYEKASQLEPENDELRFWFAVSLVTTKEKEKALKLFKEIFEKDKRWLELIDRLPPAGLLPAEVVPEIKSVMKK